MLPSPIFIFLLVVYFLKIKSNCPQFARDVNPSYLAKVISFRAIFRSQLIHLPILPLIRRSSSRLPNPQAVDHHPLEELEAHPPRPVEVSLDEE